MTHIYTCSHTTWAFCESVFVLTLDFKLIVIVPYLLSFFNQNLESEVIYYDRNRI